MDFDDVSTVWSYLVNNELFTDNELQLITCINGYNINTLNDCIYARFGYNDLTQLMEEF